MLLEKSHENGKKIFCTGSGPTPHLRCIDAVQLIFIAVVANNFASAEFKNNCHRIHASMGHRFSIPARCYDTHYKFIFVFHGASALFQFHNRIQREKVIK